MKTIETINQYLKIVEVEESDNITCVWCKKLINGRAFESDDPDYIHIKTCENEMWQFFVDEGFPILVKDIEIPEFVKECIKGKNKTFTKLKNIIKENYQSSGAFLMFKYSGQRQ